MYLKIWTCSNNIWQPVKVSFVFTWKVCLCYLSFYKMPLVISKSLSMTCLNAFVSTALYTDKCEKMFLLFSYSWTGCDNERFHSCSCIVALLFAETWINNVDDAVNGERCLCDICGHHNLQHKNHKPLPKKFIFRVLGIYQHDL